MLVLNIYLYTPSDIFPHKYIFIYVHSLKLIEFLKGFLLSLKAGVILPLVSSSSSSTALPFDALGVFTKNMLLNYYSCLAKAGFLYSLWIY